jgi:hypothetical protein
VTGQFDLTTQKGSGIDGQLCRGGAYDLAPPARQQIAILPSKRDEPGALDWLAKIER